MSLAFLDRVLTVVVTATLTSAAWIVVGSSYLGAPEETAADEAAPAEAAPAEAAGPSSSEPLRPPAEAAPGDTLLVPVEGVAAAQLTDSFDDRRGDRQHQALDIPAAAGTPVLAAAGGTVEKLFKSDDGGNTVYVRSADRRTLHYYAHLRDYAPGLREGQAVERGQRLGTVGSSGNADPASPHLHFAVMRTTPEARWWEPATAVNPYPLLRPQ
jgi:murein DD-endopeptidase MepM/ murein hydrolase activator NlpD